MLAGDVTLSYITDNIRLSLISYFETPTGCYIGTSLERWWGGPEDASMGSPLVLNRRPSGDVHRTCFGKFRRTSFGVVPRKFCQVGYEYLTGEKLLLSNQVEK